MYQKLVWQDENCYVCGSKLGNWDLRVSKAMKYGYPVCEKCIAAEYGTSVEKLRATCRAHFGAFSCLGLK